MDGDEHGIVKLTSKEGDTFDVPIEVARLSNLVVTTLGDDTNDDTNTEDVIEIPIPNVRTQVLAKVIEYCTHFHQEPKVTNITTPLKSNRIEEIVQEWYAEFVDVEQMMLFELVTAANFMDIKQLLDLTCLAVSVLIKGKSAEEIRRIFNISNNFSGEEDELHSSNTTEVTASTGKS
ncbi:hypothetical protein ACHAXM_001236 [Skeletonema potamos]